MEEEDETHSLQSPVDSSHSPAPSSPPSILPTTSDVTVAAVVKKPQSPPRNALALVVHTPSVTGGGVSANRNSRGGGGGRDDCWSEEATKVLIEAWGDRFSEPGKGTLKQQQWKEVAEIVNNSGQCKYPKTDVQCKNRIDTVKKKYKQEKLRIANGGGRSRWVFFDKLDRLIGSTAKIPTAAPGISGGGSPGGGVGGLHKIPMGIPMGTRSSMFHHQQAKAATPPFNNLDRLIGATAKVSAASFGGNGGFGGGSVNVPTGIPMSSRSNPFGQQGRMVPQQQQQQGMSMKRCRESKHWRFRKSNASDSDSESEPAMSDDSGDSLPPPPLSKRRKTEEKKKKQDGDGSGNKWRELTQAIMRFGEAYEQTENAKLQQVVEMEKERMKFLKELELQRMQFFVKTQSEISQLKQHGRRIENTSNDHHNNNINSIVNNNNNNVGN